MPSLQGQQLADVQQLELDDGLMDRIVNKVIRDTFGYFYLFYEQGIQRFDGQNFETVSTPSIDLTEVEDPKSSFSGGIYFKNEDQYYGIDPGGLRLRNISKPNYEKVEKFEPSKLDKIGQKIRVANKVYALGKGSVWTLQDNVAINLTDEQTEELNCHVVTKDKSGNYIALFGYRPRTTEKILVIDSSGDIFDYSFLLSYNNNILDIYTDNIKSKWMLATFNGLLVFNFVQEGIESFYVVQNLGKSQFGNIITSVNTNADRTIFLKESYGLWELREDKEIALLFEDQPEFFQQNQKMIYDSYHDRYYSYSYQYSNNYELCEFDLNTKKASIDILPLQITDLFNLNSEFLLIGGRDADIEKDDVSGLLYRYNKTTHETELITKDIPAIRSINYISGTKEIWLGTQYGAYIYDMSFNLKESLTSDVNKGKKYLTHPAINVAYEYNENILLGSRSGGIYVVDKISKNVMRNISERNDLSDNAIAGIISDNNHNLWISTFNGLNVYNEDLKAIGKFYEYDGLPNREFNTKSISKSSNGDLYLGTLNGLVKINPEKLLARKRTHGLHLSKIKLYQNKTTENIESDKGNVEVLNNFDSLQVEIKYPDYFQYRFDDWSQELILDTKGFKDARIKNDILTIPNLGPGNYSLNFKNSNNIYEEGIKLTIKRDLRKIFGFIGAILLVGGLIYFFFKYRVNQLKTFEEEKTRIKTKIAELELTALRAQMNPHFIFNALGSVQYFIQTQKTDKADSYLSDFAMLMRRILESSKSKFISLSEEKKLLDLYVGLENMRFENLFEYKMIVDPEVDTENPIPPMIIQPFVENAINHGLYNLSNRQGMLTIHFEHVSEDVMRCNIRDNGIGREAAKKYRKQNHKSRGLEIVTDRIQTINEQIDIDIKIHLETVDLMDENVAMGTQVIITFEYDE